MKLNKVKCIIVFLISFVVMLAALIQIPRLQNYETCLSAAIIITGAWAWFAGIIWANVVLPMTKERSTK